MGVMQTTASRSTLLQAPSSFCQVAGIVLDSGSKSSKSWQVYGSERAIGIKMFENGHYGWNTPQEIPGGDNGAIRCNSLSVTQGVAFLRF